MFIIFDYSRNILAFLKKAENPLTKAGLMKFYVRVLGSFWIGLVNRSEWIFGFGVFGNKSNRLSIWDSQLPKIK